MKANELRIGNWIYDSEEDESYTVEEIAKTQPNGLLGVAYRNGSFWSSEPEPIP